MVIHQPAGPATPSKVQSTRNDVKQGQQVEQYQYRKVKKVTIQTGGSKNGYSVTIQPSTCLLSLCKFKMLNVFQLGIIQKSLIHAVSIVCVPVNSPDYPSFRGCEIPCEVPISSLGDYFSFAT